jgi:hypothetical protein
VRVHCQQRSCLPGAYGSAASHPARRSPLEATMDFSFSFSFMHPRGDRTVAGLGVRRSG